MMFVLDVFVVGGERNVLLMQTVGKIASAVCNITKFSYRGDVTGCTTVGRQVATFHPLLSNDSFELLAYLICTNETVIFRN